MKGISIIRSQKTTGEIRMIKEGEDPKEVMRELYLDTLHRTKHINCQQTYCDEKGRFARVVDKSWLDVTEMTLCDVS